MDMLMIGGILNKHIVAFLLSSRVDCMQRHAKMNNEAETSSTLDEEYGSDILYSSLHKKCLP